MERSAHRLTLVAVALAAGLVLLPTVRLTSVAQAGTTTRAAYAAPGFRLGVAGLATNPNGSFSLWILNTQPTSVSLQGSNIFAIDELDYAAPRSGLKLSGGDGTCDQNDDSSLTCLPTIGPGQLVNLATFKAKSVTAKAGAGTVSLSSTGVVGSPQDVAFVPARDNTPAAITTFLHRAAAKSHVAYTLDRVTLGEPTEYGFVFTKTTVRHGWVTFVLSNRGAVHHELAFCKTITDEPTTCPSATYLRHPPLLDYVTPELDRGESTSLTVYFAKPGTYEFEDPYWTRRKMKGYLKVT